MHGAPRFSALDGAARPRPAKPDWPPSHTEAPALDPKLMSDLHRLLDRLQIQLAEHHRLEEEELFPRALSGEAPYGDDD